MENEKCIVGHVQVDLNTIPCRVSRTVMPIFGVLLFYDRNLFFPLFLTFLWRNLLGNKIVFSKKKYKINYEYAEL